ncbi:MAG TPA: glycosyltransferase family 4 protein [Flavobacterium sp.]|jgi:glycosyltransferase involved in cell wall biosynthesis|nr:glycosyltransferase family 4 protein [Flavobacterium sp.]
MTSKKKRILFVGSFKKTSKDGGVGGQMFACKTIVNSELSNFVDWNLIDTTADSNILASNYKRIKKAVLRLIQFTYNLIFYKHDYVLIFVADGWSFWEKGLMSVMAKWLTNSKVVLAPRSGFIINDLQKENRLSGFIRYVFNKVDMVICQSESWKDLFEKTIARKDDAKFIIIENIIDFDNYKDVEINKRGDEETVIVLFMAWVSKEKGIYELLAAAKKLKEENTKFKLLIGGLGKDYEKAVAIVEDSGLSDCVEFKGWVLGEHKIEILNQSDIFVLPTYFDGYPNSLMEAMASGKACVATKVGSIPDMINNYKTGILIDKQNEQQLYESIKVLVEDQKLRLELGANARTKTEAINSIPAGISKYKKIFNIDTKNSDNER